MAYPFDYHDVYPAVYQLERLLMDFSDTHFESDETSFQENELAKAKFLFEYESMANKIRSIWETALDLRVKLELLEGMTSPMTEAYIANTEAELKRYHEKTSKAVCQKL